MAKSSKRRIMSDINVVPYIDVMLVLLIIFMVTAPLLTQGIEVELPQADANPIDQSLTPDIEPVVLSIDEKGLYYLNVGGDEDEALIEKNVLDRVAVALIANPKVPVLVRADHRVPYGNVVSGMVLLQEAGASKIGFITEPPDPGETP